MSRRTVQFGKLTVVVENVDEDVSDEELRQIVWNKLINDQMEMNRKKVMAEQSRVAS